MTSAYELTHGRERLRNLIEFALSEGWQVRRAADGHIVFSKQGSAMFYTGAATKTKQTTLVVEGNGHG